MNAIDIEITVAGGDWPPPCELERWSERCIVASIENLGMSVPPGCTLSLMFTDDKEMRAINDQWRGKDSATNVLSFPPTQLAPGDALPPLLGDIVLAFETVRREAQEQQKSFEHHLCHLLVHGFLHLAGYDHEDDEEAEQMEQAERDILRTLAISDPYA